MSFLWGHSFIEGIAETRDCQKNFVQAGELNFCSPDLGAEARRCYIRILCFTKVWKNAVEVFPPRHVEWWCPHTHTHSDTYFFPHFTFATYFFPHLHLVHHHQDVCMFSFPRQVPRYNSGRQMNAVTWTGVKCEFFASSTPLPMHAISSSCLFCILPCLLWTKE